MRRRLAALAILACLFAGCGDQLSQAKQASGPAAMPVGSKAGYVEAAEALIAEVGEPGQRSQMPGGAAPIVVRYLSEAQSLRNSLGSSREPATDIGEGVAICEMGAKITAAYTLAGMADRISIDLPQDKVASDLQALQAENIQKYFDIFLPNMLFNQHCSAAYMPAFEKFVANSEPDYFDDVRRGGIVQMRSGVTEMVLGMLHILSDPGLTAKQREMVWSQLDEDWTRLVMALAPADRERVEALISGLSSNIPSESRVSFEELV